MPEICELLQKELFNLYSIPCCKRENIVLFFRYEENNTQTQALLYFRLYKTSKNKLWNFDRKEFKTLHLNLQKERLTKDVRYQEFNEVTLDWMVARHFSQGSFRGRVRPAANALRTRTATHTTGRTRLRAPRGTGLSYLVRPAANALRTCTATHTTGHTRLRAPMGTGLSFCPERKNGQPISRPTYLSYHRRIGMSTTERPRDAQICSLHKYKMVNLYNIPY